VEDKLHKANLISNAVNGWGKILVAVGSLIGGCFFFYYQVQSNEAAIKALEIKITDKAVSDLREFEVWGERSDKRHQRNMKTGDLVFKMLEEDRKWLIEIDRRITYIEGKLDNYEK